MLGRAEPYVAVVGATFRRQASYRAATVAGIFTNSVFGVVLGAVMVAVFRERSEIDGLTGPGAATLTFVSQGMLVIVATFGWRDLAERVRSGDVATDLLQPVSFSLFSGATFLGSSLYAAVARGTVPFLVGAAVFDL